MGFAESLLSRARAAGIELRLDDEGGILPEWKKKPPQSLMLELKANRDEIAALLEVEKKEAETFYLQCTVCRRWWFVKPENLGYMDCDVAATPGKAYTDSDGVKHARTPGCPYKHETN